MVEYVMTYCVRTCVCLDTFVPRRPYQLRSRKSFHRAASCKRGLRSSDSVRWGACSCGPHVRS